MHIAIASDYAGNEAKERLVSRLTALRHDITDVAPSVDNHGRSDYAEQVALSVLRHDADRGIIVSNRAVGASVAANRVPGIRAALCNDPYSAYLGAKSEGMNVLVLALHALTEESLQAVVEAYLDAALAPVEVIGGLPARRLQQVFAYVRENVAAELSVADMARVVGMSQYYFSKLFKTSTGTTPHQYVMRQRVERAQEILRQSQISLVKVATQVGFETQSHFTSVFRRLLGITPKRYRAMQQVEVMEQQDEKTANAA